MQKTDSRTQVYDQKQQDRQDKVLKALTEGLPRNCNARLSLVDATQGFSESDWVDLSHAIVQTLAENEMMVWSVLPYCRKCKVEIEAAIEQWKAMQAELMDRAQKMKDQAVIDGKNFMARLEGGK